MSNAESFHLHAPDARSPLKREALLIILSAQGFEDRGSKMPVKPFRFPKQTLKQILANTTPSGTCMIWNGTKGRRGYGRIYCGGGKHGAAHRIVYALAYKKIPDDFVCHHCDNPPCINPKHLFSGTPAENYLDMVNKGRGARALGSKHGMARLKESQVIKILRLKGKLSSVKIARRFNISRPVVGKILNGDIWKHVPREAA